MSKSDTTLFKTLMTDNRISRRDFLRASIATGVSMSAAASIWSGSAAAATPQRGGHFVQAMSGSSATSSMDPITYTNVFDADLGYVFAQRLFGNDPVTSDYTYELATAIDSPDGGKTWVVKLRKGVTFHNGKTMMPADVVYSLNRHRGEDSKSGAAGSLTAIQKITASGPNEVTISLDAINADLPLILTDYHLLIQPEGSTDDGVGTGGYAITEYRPGEAGILERNPNYWGEGCYFDSVECLSINDATARTTALVTGKAHLIDRVDPKTTDLLKKNSKVVIENTTGRAHYVLPMHANTAPFDNNDLRLALKYAIDRQELVDKILQGYGAVGNDFPINQAYPYFTALEQREHDPDKASYHYKKSGHSGEYYCRCQMQRSVVQKMRPCFINNTLNVPELKLTSSENPPMVTGTTSGTNNRSVHPIGRVAQRKIKCIRWLTSRMRLGMIRVSSTTSLISYCSPLVAN